MYHRQGTNKEQRDTYTHIHTDEQVKNGPHKKTHKTNLMNLENGGTKE